MQDPTCINPKCQNPRRFQRHAVPGTSTAPKAPRNANLSRFQLLLLLLLLLFSFLLYLVTIKTLRFSTVFVQTLSRAFWAVPYSCMFPIGGLKAIFVKTGA